MRRWLHFRWYRHLWHRMSPDLRWGLLVVITAVLGVGGFAAGTAIREEPSTYAAPLTTAKRTVHVREQGRIVVKRIPVVKRIYARPVTVEQTRTIKTAGGTKIVTQRVVRYKPGLPTQKVLTVRNVVTVTQSATVTQPVTVTLGRTDTVTVTQTVTVPTPAIMTMTLVTVTLTTP